jgi:hypothetical protein
MLWERKTDNLIGSTTEASKPKEQPMVDVGTGGNGRIPLINPRVSPVPG